MEGGLTWYEDPQTAVHPMFNIIPQYVGWSQIDSVIGNEDTFLDTLQLNYIGNAMYYNYHLLPTGTSFTILHANEEEHNYAIANVAEDYKTVGSTLDFGGIIDGPSPSTKYHLLGKILQFFDLEVVVVGLDEEQGIQPQASFDCFPNPVKDVMNLRLSLDKPQKVTISLSDIHGQVIRTIENNRFFGSGNHEISGNIAGLPPGLYFCTLKTSTAITSLKLIKSDY